MSADKPKRIKAPAFGMVCLKAYESIHGGNSMSADKPGFTPGPWITVAGSVFTETDIPRCYEIVHGMHLTRSGTDYQRMSDARLIAAAPDLYAALKNAPEPEGAHLDQNACSDDRPSCRYFKWYHSQRAASLAKVRGEA